MVEGLTARNESEICGAASASKETMIPPLMEKNHDSATKETKYPHIGGENYVGVVKETIFPQLRARNHASVVKKNIYPQLRWGNHAGELEETLFPHSKGILEVHGVRRTHYKRWVTTPVVVLVGLKKESVGRSQITEGA